MLQQDRFSRVLHTYFRLELIQIAENKCVFPLDKSVIQRPLLDQCTRFSCFHHGRKKRFPICKSTPGAFSDKSVFHLSKHGVDNAFGKRVRVPCTAVGPDEPHAASTAWPVGVLEQ
ncbi:putative processing peptidase [Helianthus anomalus]